MCEKQVSFDLLFQNPKIYVSMCLIKFYCIAPGLIEVKYYSFKKFNLSLPEIQYERF
jgi:hypothetical protein